VKLGPSRAPIKQGKTSSCFSKRFWICRLTAGLGQRRGCPPPFLKLPSLAMARRKCAAVEGDRQISQWNDLVGLAQLSGEPLREYLCG